MRTLAGLVSQYWWVIALRGVVAIVFGILAFAWPGVTLTALVLLFGAYAVIDGVASIVVGIKEYGERERWWATLLEGWSAWWPESRPSPIQASPRSRS